MSADFTPKHARHYTELYAIARAAAEAYRDDVATGAFPGPAESTRMDEATFKEVLGLPARDGSEAVVAGGIPLDRDL
jgi:hypothetical protein